jgi:hypothetical protein
MKVVIHDIGVELHLVDLQGSLELAREKSLFFRSSGRSRDSAANGN